MKTKGVLPLTILCLTFLIGVVSLFLLRAFSNPATTDSGTFSAIALHLLDGKKLYVDVWDNKPPGVFLLYKFALWSFGKSWTAIHVLLVGLNFIMFSSVFFALRKTLESSFFALLICLGFALVYFDVSLYSTGGLTEEFGIISITTGLALIIIFNEHKWWPLFGIALISFAPWFKEPFVFMVLVILLYLFFYQSRTIGKWRFLFAILAPHLIIGLWMLGTGIFKAYWETIIRNIAYTKGDGSIFFSLDKNAPLLLNYYWNTNYVFCLMVGVALMLLLKDLFLKGKVRNLLFYTFLGVASTYAVFMSAKGFGHYFQMGTLFLLCSVSLVLWYVNRKSKIPIYNITKYAILLCLIAVIFGYGKKASFSTSYSNLNKNHVTEHIKKKKNKGDRIFVESQNLGAMYLETGLTSEVRMPVAFNVHVATDWGARVIKKQDSLLRANPPRFVIQNKNWVASTGHFNTRDFFKNNYMVVDSMQSTHTQDFFYLLEKK